VAWDSDDDTGSLVEGEIEVFAQLVAARSMGPMGEDDFRISFAVWAGDTNDSAQQGALALAPSSGKVLAAWEAFDAIPALTDVLDEYEVMARFVLSDTISCDDLESGDHGRWSFVAP
jgi:hypothetical protein